MEQEGVELVGGDAGERVDQRPPQVGGVDPRLNAIEGVESHKEGLGGELVGERAGVVRGGLPFPLS
jgi:hypothetical protein